MKLNVKILDWTAYSVQSDLTLQCLQNLYLVLRVNSLSFHRSTYNAIFVIFFPNMWKKGFKITALVSWKARLYTLSPLTTDEKHLNPDPAE